MSTTAPRFARTTPRGRELGLDAPLPSTLAELVSERAEQHEKVAARLAELHARRIELARQLGAQEEADERAAEEAVLAGKSPAKRQKAARLRGLLEEAESEVAAFENALARSAESLLAAAGPHVVEAAEKAAVGEEAAISRAREHLGAADAALEEAANLTDEQLWLARLNDGTRIEPFRPGGRDPGIRRLRTDLGEAFTRWASERERSQGELDRQRAWEAEQEAQRVRHEEQALRDDRERRVVYEGMRLTHRGGRPVGPGGFQAEKEEQKP